MKQGFHEYYSYIMHGHFIAIYIIFEFLLKSCKNKFLFGRILHTLAMDQFVFIRFTYNIIPSKIVF